MRNTKELKVALALFLRIYVLFMCKSEGFDSVLLHLTLSPEISFSPWKKLIPSFSQLPFPVAKFLPALLFNFKVLGIKFSITFTHELKNVCFEEAIGHSCSTTAAMQG